MPRKPKQQTRAQYYGVSATSLAKKSQAHIARMRAKILQMPEPWLDTDPTLERYTSEAVAALDALSKAYADSAEYLNEPFDE